MRRSTWRVLAFAALLGVAALPASAQVVIGGGSSAPSVEVDWSVLDNLGRQPNLADMLKADVPGAENRPAAVQPTAKAQGVHYQPYKPGATPYAKTAKPGKAAAHPAKVTKAPKPTKPVKPAKPAKAAAPAPKKAPVLPASDVVPAKPAATPSVAPKEAAVEPAKPAVGPQISLPELPKPAAPQAKAEVTPPAAPKVADAKVEAKPAPLPPSGLTPPPMPVAKTEAPQQLAAVPPVPVAAPAPAPTPVAPTPAAAPARGADVLTVPFSADSARLPDSARTGLDRLVKRMQQDDGVGLQLLAYAEGDDANASKARRLSLSRALEVRKYLMEQGLRSTRIEVRALGNKVEGNGSADRVDAVLVSR